MNMKIVFYCELDLEIKYIKKYRKKKNKDKKKRKNLKR